MVYKVRSGSHLKVDAQVAGEHLERLREANGGLSARLVLDDAKAQESPIHEEFEWDNERAGEEYRLWQARHLMNSMVVVVSGDGEVEKTTRAFVVVTQNDQDRYESIHVVMDDPVMRQQVLTRALRELESWEKKYKELEEFAGVFKAVEKARKKLA